MLNPGRGDFDEEQPIFIFLKWLPTDCLLVSRGIIINYMGRNQITPWLDKQTEITNEEQINIVYFPNVLPWEEHNTTSEYSDQKCVTEM